MGTKYLVVSYGNRIGARIRKDYSIATVNTYKQARELKAFNNGWASIEEGTTLEVKGKAREFYNELLAQCLSVSLTEQVA